MVLLLALLCIGGAAFALGEAATYPARVKARSIRRAAEYGRYRIPRSEQELVHFRQRVLSPLAGKLAAIPLKLSPKTSVEAIGARLVAAGLTQRLTSSAFLTIKGGALVAGCAIGLLIAAVGSLASAVIVVPIGGAVGLIVPEVFLTMKTRARREAVRSELPDALDLLAVSVEAGLGFDAAVAKLVDHMEGPLIDEFALMISEIRVGETRTVALRKMSERVDAAELANFVRAVIQAEQLGISLGRILRVQATDTRLRRQAAAEEKAMKAPIKMLFPTVFFIFPALFIVVLGPAFLNILSVFK
ncbi:MAG TPA: type II secretion system F family protein [Gaiellaceae bacterium]|jgi:tight adherence protein C|nr:type II secretion system F family protein [Gaiellaceae bacterium]